MSILQQGVCVYDCVTRVWHTGPEYLKKRALQDGMDVGDNADTTMHEPLLAEEEPLPTPPDSPPLNELNRLMPGSTPARTPSPSPGITDKEDPKLLGPGSWNGQDKSGSSRPGSAGSSGSRANSRPASRPVTPSASAPASAAAAEVPEGADVAPSSRGPSRPPSRQSSKAEQGSDLEIKPLQKFDGEEESAAAPVASASVRNSLISQNEDDEPPRPALKAPPKAAQKAEPKPAEAKSEPAPPPPVQPMQAPSVSQLSAGPGSREPSRPASRAETKPGQRREPSPAPSPTPKLEAKFVAKPVEARAAIGQSPVSPPTAGDPKVEAKPKTITKASSKEMTVDSVELEVRLLVFTVNVHSTECWNR